MRIIMKVENKFRVRPGENKIGSKIQKAAVRLGMRFDFEKQFMEKKSEKQDVFVKY